jgi:hypothetical protein
MPKEVDEEVVESAEEVEGDDTLTESEKEADTTVNEPPKVEKKDIQIESPEEVSFNALTCFGWSETKTPNWLIKCAHFWYGAMSFFWFVFGALTFAPIIFMQKKVNVIFKDKLKSFIVAAVIYGVFLALIVLLFVSRNGDKAQEVVNVADQTVYLG